jgi:vancomycin permeability regulator SanA
MGAVEPKVRGWRLAGAAVLLAFGGLVGPNAWVARAARGHAYRSLSSLPARSVAIVPGAAVHRGQPLASLNDRLEAALVLYREGRVKSILVSGKNDATSPEVSVMRAWLAARGVAPADVWSDEAGSRTRETMLNAASRFNVSDAIICTQERYLPRALFLARHAGINAVGVALQTPLPRSSRAVGTEALKTTLAFLESYLRQGPATDQIGAPAPTTVALR